MSNSYNNELLIINLATVPAEGNSNFPPAQSPNVERKLPNNQTAMKILIAIFFLTLSFRLIAQHKIVGHYRNHFGGTIQLNADSTFECTWHFDMEGSWTKGKWSINNDTIYLHMIPVYDTVGYKNNDVTSSDTLILSEDEKPERLTREQFINMGHWLSSVGQNRQGYPDKLFFKRQRLFVVRNGKLIKKKIRRIWPKKKWHPWYFKSDD
jgi:hypothetical protein